MESRTRARRLTLFGAVCFVQGAVLTYFSTFNALYLRTFDLSVTRIGIVGGITLIPFVLKIFIGLLIIIGERALLALSLVGEAGEFVCRSRRN